MVTATPPDDLIELHVGKPAAGGGFVSRLPDGRVAFVRHALPGETVLARVTEENRSFVRADAIVVGEAAEGRVRPPCRHAGPNKCGGCDYQHAALPLQRELKASLISEQLERLAGLSTEVAVEAVAGDSAGLGWRTRVRYSVLPRGRVGFRKSRSHEIHPIEACPLAVPAIAEMGLEQLSWMGASDVEAFALGGEAVVSVSSKRRVHFEPPRYDGGLVVDERTRREPSQLETKVLGRRFQVGAGSFWQVHAGAPRAISDAVRELLGDCEGANAADLYSGVGLLSVLLADAVGPTGHVIAVERDGQAVRDAERNTASYHNVDIARGAVTREAVARELRTADIVVLDPPRDGAGIDTMAALAGLKPRLRKVVYVSCDPASFARDLRVMLDDGWELTALRALDLFPMTEHVELVALIQPVDG